METNHSPSDKNREGAGSTTQLWGGHTRCERRGPGRSWRGQAGSCGGSESRCRGGPRHAGLPAGRKADAGQGSGNSGGRDRTPRGREPSTRATRHLSPRLPPPPPLPPAPRPRPGHRGSRPLRGLGSGSCSTRLPRGDSRPKAAAGAAGAWQCGVSGVEPWGPGERHRWVPRYREGSPAGRLERGHTGVQHEGPRGFCGMRASGVRNGQGHRVLWL